MCEGGDQGESGPQNWRSPQGLCTCVSLCLNHCCLSSLQGWLLQFTYVVHTTPSKAFPATTFRSSLKGKIPTRYCLLCSSTCNLYHQLAICHKLSDVSVGMPSTSPPPCPREVSSGRAGFSVPTLLSSASVRA